MLTTFKDTKQIDHVVVSIMVCDRDKELERIDLWRRRQRVLDTKYL